MHGLARLTAVATLTVATGPVDCECGMPSGGHARDRRSDPGSGGLHAFLYEREYRRTDCEEDRETTRRFVTPGYENVTANPTAFREAWARPGDIVVRRLYADDTSIPAALRRSRPAMPVGSEPYVAFVAGEAIPAVFVYFDGEWRCVVDVDGFIVASLPPDCGAAYAGSSTGRCMDLTAPLAAAVLGDDDAASVRLCRLLVEHGCGSVPAEATPPTAP